MPSRLARRNRWRKPPLRMLLAFIFFFGQYLFAPCLGRMTPPFSRMISGRQNGGTPLIITNSCEGTIYPGILTQSGQGPGTGGFELSPGDSRTLGVSENWQGRVWGRTNCSFNGDSGQCGTGDCGGVVSCIGTGNVPTTLAEFTLDAGDGHTYYDISLVDGYNLPLAIVMHPDSNSSFEEIPPNLTNPSCVGTVGEAQAPDYNPYNSNSYFLGTNASDPLPFEDEESLADIAQWCPWNLQSSSSTGPSGGVYIYPDGNLNRPAFDPCYSACSRWNQPQDCCTGAYGSPSSCQPSQYSLAAKAVCPDAYSYGKEITPATPVRSQKSGNFADRKSPMLAFDDQTSTFIIPSGAGFEVVFCPGARSTNIIATSKGKLVELAQQGQVSGSRSKRQTLPQMFQIELMHNASDVIKVPNRGSKVDATLYVRRNVALILWSLGLLWML